MTCSDKSKYTRVEPTDSEPKEQVESLAEYVPVVIVVRDGKWTYELRYNHPPAVCASVVLGAAWRLSQTKGLPERKSK